ncbi:putative dolichyl pyrophosphate Glc1Man9GlcNAc2 alpha-1,3-glucosyltransferase [Vitis vinifera]|uniref:Alpha-1,3-glucosyltransferase n=1 Tax=Vitis vinifera TaxID=29760 RepID=A0A438CAG3_VITVI|nr:putative dolichyl pyrophosphate Glc1Man9GlcNAc2 alpha-1,3-glucosyltransferase [Vitis vinifera]
MEEKLQRPHKNPGGTLQSMAWYALVAACIKLLLIPSYHSTDFEVHRNWLALTHSLPLSQWYSDETSPWTLDYPPFFAYFERFLSIFANLIDPTIVNLRQGLNYNSNTVIYFQRMTVIVSDLCLFFALYRLTAKLDSGKRNLIWVLVASSPGLFIVDHVHFQYNGFLLGILLLSLSFLEEGRDLMGGFVFAVLLCFKHLFAVAAPVYFVFSAFGPFVYYGQVVELCQLKTDEKQNYKGLAFLLRNLGFNIQAPAASFTGGLVGDSSPFAILPSITPLTTFIMVVLAISPALIKACRNPRPEMITRWVAYAYTCGFIFGWHVHEKASLHFVIPLAIVAMQSLEDAKHYFLLSIVSSYSLFPLLFEAQEYPIKVLLLLLHSIVMWLAFSAHSTKNGVINATAPANKGSDKLEVKGSSRAATKKGDFVIGWIGKIYLLGLLVVEIWGQFLHPYLLGSRFPFVPLC